MSTRILGISSRFGICRYLWQSTQHFWAKLADLNIGHGRSGIIRWLLSQLEVSTLWELHGYFPGPLQPLWRHRGVHRFYAETLSSIQPSGWEWFSGCIRASNWTYIYIYLYNYVDIESISIIISNYIYIEGMTWHRSPESSAVQCPWVPKL